MIEYTVVQHSAWVGNQDPQFQRGLETAAVRDARQKAAIEKRGGLVFPGYIEADDYAMEEQYRDVAGLIPSAPGTFDPKYAVDGRPIYIPRENVR